MKKPIRDIKIRATVKACLFLLIGSAYVFFFAYMELYPPAWMSLAATVFCSFFPVAEMFYSFKYADKYLKEYLEKTNYTEDILANEYNSSQKAGILQIGYTHVFLPYFRSLRIVPISDIKAIEVQKKRPRKSGSMRWIYQVHLIKNDDRGYFINFPTKTKAENAVRQIALRNQSISVRYWY